MKGVREMAERIWEYLRGFSVLLSDVAVCMLMIGFVPMIGGWEFSCDLAVWLGGIAIQLFLGMLLISLGTTWTVFLIVQGAAITGEVIAVCLRLQSVSYLADMRLLVGIVAFFVGIHAAVAAYRQPKANTILGYVDTLIVLLAFYLYTEYAAGRSQQTLWVLSLGAMAFDMLVIGHLRVHSEEGHQIQGASAAGKIMLAVLPLTFILVTGAAVGVASGQIHSAVDLLLVIAREVGAVLSVIFGAIGNVLAAIILFLIRILPDAQQNAAQESMTAMGEMAEIAEEESGGILPVWVFPLIFGLFLAGLAIWILYQLRDKKIFRAKIRTHRHKVVRKSYLLPMIIAFLRRFAEAVVFEWHYLRCRRSPQGLLVLAERTGRKHRLRRHPGESPGGYVRRLSREGLVDESDSGTAQDSQAPQNSEKYAENKEILIRLAGLLDDIFYGGETVTLTGAEYRGYVSAIRGIRRKIALDGTLISR